MKTLKSYSYELLDFILQKKPDVVELNNKKTRLSKKYGLKKIPLNSEILSSLDKKDRQKIKKYLEIKNIRSKAGVSVIAVMTKPHPCPHGKCTYCPGGVDKNVPQSYTGFEPATMRAILNNYDPYLQTKNRIEQLEAIGHNVSKIELIIMGGTFNSLDTKYKEWFVRGIYDAISGMQSYDLMSAKQNVEFAEKRPIGLTLETRPDWMKKDNILEALKFGTTRVELGVQTLSDKVYEAVHRGHSVKDVEESTRLLKDSGFKVLYHMMPGLLVKKKQDVDFFKTLFKDDRFKPDMLKIYPTLVMEGTGFYEMWKRKEYFPYTDDELIDLIETIYPVFPYWVRVMRVQRDIPSTKVAAGPKKSNIRDIVIKRLKKNQKEIKEIRFREIGNKTDVKPPYKIFVEKYKASKGTEFFISYETEDRKTLIGFLRLRFPYKPFIDTLKDNVSIVRELHIYGNVVPIHKTANKIGQHKGIGQLLLKKAEDISRDNGFEKIAVISGIGVREYYYKFGYFLDGYFVSKWL